MTDKLTKQQILDRVGVGLMASMEHASLLLDFMRTHKQELADMGVDFSPIAEATQNIITVDLQLVKAYRAL